MGKPAAGRQVLYVYLPTRLVAALRAFAVEKSRSLSDIVEAALRAYRQLPKDPPK